MEEQIRQLGAYLAASSFDPRPNLDEDLLALGAYIAAAPEAGRSARSGRVTRLASEQELAA
jgi:hypothetical protein